MDNQSKSYTIVVVMILVLINAAIVAAGYFYISKLQKNIDALELEVENLKKENEGLKALGIHLPTAQDLEGARKKSRDARRIADTKQLQLALELYFDAHGAYPGSLSELSAQSGCGRSACIPLIPSDPRGTNGLCRPNYCYAYPASGLIKTYHLGAQLEAGDNSALKYDKDFDSKKSGYRGNAFDGNDTGLIYDLTP